MQAAALKLAERGTAVFPVSLDKKPKTARGFYDASADEAVIQSWDWNDSLLAIAIPEGTVILDVDPRNGGEGTMDAFRQAGQQLPKTRVVRTGGGGFHYYFQVPEDLALRAGLGPGVDVKRAGKGYVVVPPSSGYTYLSGYDPAPLPEWLEAELRVEEREGPTAEPSDPKFQQFEEGTPYGQRALESEVGRVALAKEGSRNDTLNRAAYALGQLAAGGEVSESLARERLMEVALKIGLEPDETKATIDSGMKAGGKAPRQAAPQKAAGGGMGKQTFSPEAQATEVEWMDWDIDEKPHPFYLNPIFPKNAYILIFGASEASKSMVVMGLCAEGSRLGIKTSFYSLENPAHVDRERLRRWKPHKENFRITQGPLDLIDREQMNALIKREKEWSTDLLVLDTYSHVFGARTEDGNAKAIDFARRCRAIMEEVGCTIVLIDHTGYGDQMEPRDASAKRQQVDQAILMQKVGEWQPGEPARFSMLNRKAARFGNPFAFTGEIQDRNNYRELALVWTDGGHGAHGGMPEWED